ncbi:MAG: Gfo/Idh/MocA family oxidoreductase [Verrucomicrobia bacterium]|nr:Gfo/Idh/MocA family oxidoreductase [Verrucomicrobiota bacterium]
MNRNIPFNRRKFLKHISAGTAGIAAAPWLARGAAGAKERLNLGLIGTGDRGSYLMKEIIAASGKCNVNITAVCDVWRKNREAAAAQVKQHFGREPKGFTRFGELLASPDVDAVVIATPDFSHGPILVAALEAGKDVYVEKPMTIDIATANQALDLARAKDRVVQAGTQHRSEGRYRSAAKFVATGALGKLSRITAAMAVNAPRWARKYDDCHEADVDWEAFCLGRIHRPFNPRLLRCWQLFRDTTNGIAGLWMTHYADSVHLITGSKYPANAVANGGIYVWRDGREHTDTFQALLEYPEGYLFDWGMFLGNSAGIHFTMHGTQGTLDLEAWSFSTEGAAEVKVGEAKTTKLTVEPDVSHMENWLQCLRSRAKPNADIQFGHQHAVATIMAATALETGLRQKWDSAKRELVAG